MLYSQYLPILDKTDDVEVDGSFKMNTTYVECNKFNFAALLFKNIVQGSFRTDAWVLVKFLLDPRDINDLEKFKAWIATDRRGMYVMEPSMPYFFLHDFKQLGEVEKKYDNSIGDVSGEIEVQAVAINSDTDRQTKTTYIEFPHGLKANLDFEWEYGSKKGSIYIEPRARVIPIKMPIGIKPA
jgi:hypothetical protein